MDHFDAVIRSCHIARALALAMLVSAAAPGAAQNAPTLGAATVALEARLAGDPAAAVAGEAATERYAAGLLAAAFPVFEQSRHLDSPYFGRTSGIDGRPGLSNPDNIYESALLADDGEYRIHGRRGTHAMLTLQILDAYPIVALGRNLAAIDLDAAGVVPGAEFELRLGGAARDGLWYALPHGARALLVRQSFEDWDRETPSQLHIERLDRTLRVADGAGLGDAVADFVVAVDRLWNANYLPMIRRAPLNTLPSPRASDIGAGGLGGQQSVMMRYRLAPDQALLITVRKSAARYQGIQLGDPWFVTPNWIEHQVSLTRAQAATDADGYMRFVISLRDPGVANWLDPAGFAEGFVFMRWQGLPAPLAADEAPTAQLVVLDDMDLHLPLETLRMGAAARAVQLAQRARAPVRQ